MQRTEWYPLLPPELTKAAYKAGNEMAWPKQQALQVIDMLEANGCIASGVQVWIPTNPAPTIPTPFIYDWRLKPLPRTGSHPDTAKEFVQTFEWDPTDTNHQGRSPVFNISARKKNS